MNATLRTSALRGSCCSRIGLQKPFLPVETMRGSAQAKIINMTARLCSKNASPPNAACEAKPRRATRKGKA